MVSEYDWERESERLKNLSVETLLSDHPDLFHSNGNPNWLCRDRLLGGLIEEVVRLRDRVEELEKKTWLD